MLTYPILILLRNCISVLLRLLQEAREQKKGLRKAVPKVNRAIKPSTRSLVVVSINR